VDRVGAGLAGDGLFTALLTAALRMWAKVGGTPQARHFGNGVWGPAVSLSKLAGTEFGSPQMTHIQVAGVTVGDSTRGDL
jgi:hypothetical protein